MKQIILIALLTIASTLAVIAQEFRLQTTVIESVDVELVLYLDGKRAKVEQPRFTRFEMGFGYDGFRLKSTEENGVKAEIWSTRQGFEKLDPSLTYPVGDIYLTNVKAVTTSVGSNGDVTYLFSTEGRKTVIVIIDIAEKVEGHDATLAYYMFNVTEHVE